MRTEYKFQNLGALADYMILLANQKRESAAGTKAKGKQARLMEAAATWESAADLLRSSMIVEGK